MGEVATAPRQWEDAERVLGDALAIARAIGNPRQFWTTHAALGRLHAERKNMDLARQAYQAARGVLDGIKSALCDPRLRAGFETSPLIRRVYDLSRSPS